jgi:hypothetical protein
MGSRVKDQRPNPETGIAPVGETSLTGGDLDRIKTGKLTLTGYLAVV